MGTTDEIRFWKRKDHTLSITYTQKLQLNSFVAPSEQKEYASNNVLLNYYGRDLWQDPYHQVTNRFVMAEYTTTVTLYSVQTKSSDSFLLYSKN